jgi:hypothetical protein
MNENHLHKWLAKWTYIFALALCSNSALAYYVDAAGEPTNGISADVNIHSATAGSSKETISVIVCIRRHGETLTFPPTNATRHLIGSYYWGATNMFCGPMELRNEQGEKVSLLKPEILLPEFYPAKYDLRPLYDDFFKKFLSTAGSYPNVICPGRVPYDFLCKNDAWYSYTNFKLQDYFKIKRVGTYKLTIWPVIYKRHGVTGDIFEKIEVPPVTVSYLITPNMLE